jgi:hypothetical protein
MLRFIPSAQLAQNLLLCVCASSPIFAKMTFYEKYSQLKDQQFLEQLLTNTVYATMCLENQEVSKPKVNEIVLSQLTESNLKNLQFLSNKTAQ